MICASFFSLMLAMALFTFRLRKTDDMKEIMSLLPAFVFLGLFIMVTGLFSFYEADSWKKQAALTAVESMADFQDMKNRSPVMVKGKVSEAMKPVHEDFVAYFSTREGDEESEDRKTPPLLIALTDGTVGLCNENYQAGNWPCAGSSSPCYHLKVGTEIVVLGAIQDMVHMKDRKKEKCIDARLVFAGSPEVCRKRLEQKSLWPAVSGYAALVMGMPACGAPLIYSLQVWIKKRSGKK